MQQFITRLHKVIKLQRQNAHVNRINQELLGCLIPPALTAEFGYMDPKEWPAAAAQVCTGTLVQVRSC